MDKNMVRSEGTVKVVNSTTARAADKSATDLTILVPEDL
jgi:hypothetical protein